MSQKKQSARPFARSAIGFLPEYLDFQKGIHVGNLDENQRITRILKLALEARYQESFVTERYGRGVYWQWIGFLPRSNRDAKPISSKVSFGCSKFFLTVDADEQLFKCGFSVERGMIQPPDDFPKIQLKSDWDWHRLLRSLNAFGRDGARVEAPGAAGRISHRCRELGEQADDRQGQVPGHDRSEEGARKGASGGVGRIPGVLPDARKRK